MRLLFAAVLAAAVWGCTAKALAVAVLSEQQIDVATKSLDVLLLTPAISTYTDGFCIGVGDSDPPAPLLSHLDNRGLPMHRLSECNSAKSASATHKGTGKKVGRILINSIEPGAATITIRGGPFRQAVFACTVASDGSSCEPTALD